MDGILAGPREDVDGEDSPESLPESLGLTGRGRLLWEDCGHAKEAPFELAGRLLLQITEGNRQQFPKVIDGG